MESQDLPNQLDPSNGNTNLRESTQSDSSNFDMEVDPTPALRVPNVCRWCGQVGHQRRSSRLCTYRILRRPRNTETSNNSTENPVNNSSESTAPSEPVSEPVIGEPDATTTENTDDLPDISESINNGGRMGADSRVTCPYCGREGHVRNTHSNCAMNSSRQSTRSQNTHNLRSRSFATQIYVSACSRASTPFSERDLKNDEIYKKLNNIDGNTQGKKNIYRIDRHADFTYNKPLI